MARSFVKISLDQYKDLDTLRREKKELLSKLIREALCFFIKKQEHSIRVLPSFLSASYKDLGKFEAPLPRDFFQANCEIEGYFGRRELVKES